MSLHGSNQWVYTAIASDYSDDQVHYGAGRVTLSGALDRVGITTTAGSNSFNAGTVNILYE